MEMTLVEVRRLRDEGNYPTATRLLGQLHKQNPLDPRVWSEQAMILMLQKEHRKALRLFTNVHEAFTIAEDLATKSRDKRRNREERARSAYHAGLCAGTLGEWELSQAWMKVATELDPTPESLSSLASTHYIAGDWTQGLLTHDRALRATTRSPMGDFAKSMIRMMRGEVEGFKQYESRFSIPSMKPHREVDLPRWTGVEPGRVLVISEQGFGDSIMMERYLKHIPLCTVSCQRELVMWLYERGHLAISNRDAFPSITNACDYQIPMMSLPAVFGKVTPEPSKTLIYGQVLNYADRRAFNAPYRVGLCWKGNAENSSERDRSGGGILESLWGTEGYDWVSLTYGERGFQPKDFLETANLIETLDAVVTTDTAVAHMAGTLGVPTYMIPASAPEWRWGEPRAIVEQSEWYPSMTIVRKKRMDGWTDAIAKVMELLGKQLARRAA